MRILLAEDEKMLSKALVTILQRHNYAVDAVFNGQDALDQLLSMDYDGAILDVMMPEKDGIAVLQEFRQHNQQTPVLMLTAKTDVEDRVMALDGGADDYLAKPFAAQELLARIRAMLRRSSGAADNVLRLGNLTLNCATFVLSAPKGTYRLNRKEFQMLELLMINHGKVVTTERLLDQIWGLESNPEINVVWTYLSYLRKKLVSIGADCKIKAMRNLGYVLEQSHD
ncbi:MAG: response regulator transcription factor [Prevotella sp.]|nr:response regulator transcription factor [Prevotella sp.]